MLKNIKIRLRRFIQNSVDDAIIKSNKDYLKKMMYLQAISCVHSRTFLQFKNSFVGKDLVLCGAGPSLKNYIPLKDVIHFALNRALLNKSIKYDFFIADDYLGINFMKDELIKYNCVKFFGHQIGSFEREIPESLALKCGAYRYYTDSFIEPNGYKSELVCDIDSLPLGNMPNIAISALQILLYMNPKRIYLVGCDATSDGHFINKNKNGEVDNEGLDYAVDYNATKKSWLYLKNFAKTHYPNTEIISVNPVGLTGLFTDYIQENDGTLIKKQD